MKQEEKELLLTEEEIINKLKMLRVDTGENPPIKRLFMVVPNPDYDPDNFSQEIEDSEKGIDWIEEMTKRTSDPNFDFVWNNTLGEIPKNSEKWQKNHNKILKVIYVPLLVACCNHSDGTRDYYSENILKTIKEYSDKYGGIYDIF